MTSNYIIQRDKNAVSHSHVLRLLIPFTLYKLFCGLKLPAESRHIFNFAVYARRKFSIGKFSFLFQEISKTYCLYFLTEHIQKLIRGCSTPYEFLTYVKNTIARNLQWLCNLPAGLLQYRIVSR